MASTTARQQQTHFNVWYDLNKILATSPLGAPPTLYAHDPFSPRQPNDPFHLQRNDLKSFCGFYELQIILIKISKLENGKWLHYSLVFITHVYLLATKTAGR